MVNKWNAKFIIGCLGWALALVLYFYVNAIYSGFTGIINFQTGNFTAKTAFVYDTESDRVFRIETGNVNFIVCSRFELLTLSDNCFATEVTGTEYLWKLKEHLSVLNIDNQKIKENAKVYYEEKTKKIKADYDASQKEASANRVYNDFDIKFSANGDRGNPIKGSIDDPTIAELIKSSEKHDIFTALVMLTTTSQTSHLKNRNVSGEILNNAVIIRGESARKFAKITDY